MKNVVNMYHRPNNRVKWVWFGILAVVMVILLASCSVTGKNKSSIKTKDDTTIEEKKGIDTSSTVKTDLNQESKSETTTGSQEETEVKKELNVDFGNGSAADFTDTVIGDVKVTTTGTGIVKINPDGSIEAKGNIRNARYRETGKTKKQDSTRQTTNTNTALQVTDNKKGIDTTQVKVHQVTTVDIKTKEKQTISYWGWLWLALIVAAATYVCWRFKVLKWFAALFRRDDDYYPTKRTT